MLISDSASQPYVAKVPSTPDDFAQGVLNGLEVVLAESGRMPGDVTFFVHSSTVALNALIERKGAKVGLLTTEGFRDVLEIGRASRMHEYDLFQVRPQPLVPRRLRLTVRERMDSRGNELVALDPEGVRHAARHFEGEGVEAVAVCFLHSYANPNHEQEARTLLTKHLSGPPIYLSSDINPIYREYERTSTTVVNAYIAPRVVGYLERLERELAGRGWRGRLHVVQSSGGIMTSSSARERSVHMLLAGPAAGVVAGVYVAERAGYANILTLDTGGTTQLISLVDGGKIQQSITGKLDGIPVRVPMIDVRAIGAGGGSIAHIDSGGLLRVGPTSAGANPGPACYGRGGKEPTVTDADVVLGYLDPSYFLGGKLKLDRGLAERALMERIGTPLGLDAIHAAAGVINVVNTTRVSAIRKLLLERGVDARDFSVVAFGGAGPVHASQLLRELDLARVVVPIHPGLASPLGALKGDIRRDHVKTVGELIDRVPMDSVRRLFDTLGGEAEASLSGEGISVEAVEIDVNADMKYVGQLHETAIHLSELTFDEAGRDRIKHAFYEEHRRLYSYAVEDEAVMLVNLRVTASYRFPDTGRTLLRTGGSLADAYKGDRQVFFDEIGHMVATPIFERERMMIDSHVEGPAIVEEYDSTTVILPGQRGTIDNTGNIIIMAVQGRGPS